MIRNLIKEKELLISDVKSSQIKHIASVHNALSTLPNFHTASIKDIIDIRKELKKYLSRFRGAMMKYSDSLRNMPWDNDFSSELSLLFINEVDPCIAEIRSIVEQNSALKKFCTNILNDKISVLPLITACLNMSVLPLAEAIKLPSAIATMVSGGIIVGKNLINTHNEYLLEKKKAQENSLYFYYSLSKRIKGK